MRIEFAGESSLIVYFEQASLLENNHSVSILDRALVQSNYDWLIDCTPSYQSLLVRYDPLKTDFLEVKKALRECQSGCFSQQKYSSKEHRLHALYQYPLNNDLQRIADFHDISIETVIALHSEVQYQVFAIGFAPGFAFLGEVDPRIAMPRLPTPRLKVPKGSIAIADRQTAVYPNETPGGWNIIGLCPDTLFDSAASVPCQFKVGDSVSFSPISKDTFIALGGDRNAFD